MKSKRSRKFRCGQRVRVDEHEDVYIVWTTFEDSVSLLRSDVSLMWGPEPGDETACLDRVPLDRITAVGR